MGYYDLNVKFDNEDKRKSKNWRTQYASTYQAPPSDYREPKRLSGAPIAGVTSSPFRTDFNKAHEQIPGRTHTQREYFGSTFPLDHRGEQDPGLQPTSYNIGYGTKKTDSQLKKPKAKEFAGVEIDRLLPSYKPISKNDRTCWNRNASNVGTIVFKEPKNFHQKSTSRSMEGHFVTIRQTDDARIRTAATKMDAYNADNVKFHSGYSVRNRAMDDTTISGDSPAWMQIPGVNVSSLNSLQLQSLLTWSAPLPKKHVDPKLLGVFQVGDHEAPEFHPELAHLPAERQQKFRPGMGGAGHRGPSPGVPPAHAPGRTYEDHLLKPMSPAKKLGGLPSERGGFLKKGGGTRGAYKGPDNYNSGFNLADDNRSIGSVSSKSYGNSFATSQGNQAWM